MTISRKNYNLPIDQLLLLFTALISIHNAEEYIFAGYNKTVMPFSIDNFRVAVVFVTVLFIVIYFLLHARNNEKQSVIWVTALASMMTLNAFIPHIAATVRYSKYTAGVVSGLFILLPAAVFILVTVYSSQLLSRRVFWVTVVSGPVIGIAMLWGLIFMLQSFR